MAEFTINQVNKRIAADPDMQKLHVADPTEFDSQVAQMYDSFGFDPTGVPLNRATKVAKSVEGVTGIPRESLKSAAAMGISTAATMGGASVGTPGGLLGIAGGTVIGSLAGERVNKALGLTDESSDAAAMLSPLLPTAVGKGLLATGKLTRSVPGVGTSLHQLAGENLEAAMSKFRVTPQDVTAFSKLLDTVPDFRIKVPLLKQAVEAELNRASSSQLPDMTYINKLNELTAKWKDNPAISFKSLMATEHSFNDLKEASPNAVWKKLSGVLVDEMDAAVQSPGLSQATRDKIAQGSSAYKNLIKVNRKLHANTALDNLTKTAVTEVNGDPNLVRFNKTAFTKQLKFNKAFDTTEVGSTFNDNEIQSMREAVDDVGYLGWGPSGGTQSASSYIGRSGAAGAIGYTVAGGSKGAMAGFAAAAVLSQALESELGRRIVKYLAKNGGGHLDVLELKTMLGKSIAGANSGAVAGVSGMGAQPTGVTAENQE